MADSPTPAQRDKVQKLGEWRDAGHRLAVGLDGKVSIHLADKGDYHVATQQREGAARRQGPSGRQRTAGSRRATGSRGAAAPSKPAGEDGSANVRSAYLTAVPEIREYYPDLRVIDVEDGIWVVTQIFPIGRDGPSFSVCLFLSDDKTREAKAFAFADSRSSREPVGPRHTNFPDASICAFCADDDVWSPGQSPHVLLDLYAEWLVCHLFREIAGYWPGPQWGDNADYRQAEFTDREWCFCGRGKRYGSCHAAFDAQEVARLQRNGGFQESPAREVPEVVLRFAHSGWRLAPSGEMLRLRDFISATDARETMDRSRYPEIFLRLDSSTATVLSFKTRLLSSSSQLR